MGPPQAISCDICNQKFFKRSLPIHRKQCLKKYEQSFTECPKCLRKVSNDEFGKHKANCKVVRTQRVAKPKIVKERPIKPRDENYESGSETSSDEEDDPREECGFCHRKFNPDRIAKHEQICATNASRKKRKQFKSTSEARLEGTDFEAYKDPNKRRQVEKSVSGKWRQDHERLKNIVEQGRLVSVFKEAGVPLTEMPSSGADLQKLAEGTDTTADIKPEDRPVPEGMVRCPHCTRTFNENSGAKHIPKCKTTKNKPKTLVRKSKPVLEKPKVDHSGVIKSLIKKVLLMRTKKNEYFETKEASMFHEGEAIVTWDGRPGHVRYVGRVSELFPGYWLGLELEKEEGTNDGSAPGGPYYFKCTPGHGLFVRPSKVKKKIVKVEAPPKVAVNGAKKKGSEDEKERFPAPIEKSSKKSTKVQKGEQGAKSSEAKAKVGMVEKLRKEVSQNSPRLQKVTKSPNQEPQQQVAKKKEKKPVAKANAAKAAKQKRIEKDAKFLEALHGKTMPKGEAPAMGSREELGTGHTLGGGGQKAGPGQKTGKKGGKPSAASDREARAAYFERMLAQKQS